MPQTSLKVGQTLPYSLQELDAAGVVVSPAVPFDAPPTWTVDDPTIATVAAAADGLTAVLTAVAVGNVTVTSTGLIDGVSVTGSDPVVVADVVASLRLVPGTPGTSGGGAPQK